MAAHLQHFPAYDPARLGVGSVGTPGDAPSYFILAGNRGRHLLEPMLDKPLIAGIKQFGEETGSLRSRELSARVVVKARCRHPGRRLMLSRVLLVYDIKNTSNRQVDVAALVARQSSFLHLIRHEALPCSRDRSMVPVLRRLGN